MSAHDARGPKNPDLWRYWVTVALSVFDDVTASTVYFRPQQVDDARACSTQLGIGPERPWPAR